MNSWIRRQIKQLLSRVSALESESGSSANEIYGSSVITGTEETVIAAIVDYPQITTEDRSWSSGISLQTNKVVIQEPSIMSWQSGMGAEYYIVISGSDVPADDGIYPLAGYDWDGGFPSYHHFYISGSELSGTTATSVSIVYYVRKLKLAESCGLGYGDEFYIQGSTSIDGQYYFDSEEEIEGFYYVTSSNGFPNEDQTEFGNMVLPAQAEPLIITHNLNTNFIAFSLALQEYGYVFTGLTSIWNEDNNTYTIDSAGYGLEIGQTVLWYFKKLGETVIER